MKGYGKIMTLTTKDLSYDNEKWLLFGDDIKSFENIEVLSERR